MISHTRLVAEVNLPGGEQPLIRSWPFPLQQRVSFGSARSNTIRISSAQAENIEIEIENDYQHKGGVEIHSHTFASLECGGKLLPFGKDCPRMVTLHNDPILLKFKGVEARISLQQIESELETKVAALDATINRMHQELAQEDLGESLLNSEIERRSNGLIRDSLDDEDQQELARGYLKRLWFCDALGSSLSFNKCGGIESFICYVQTILCRQLIKSQKLDFPCIVEPSFIRNRELPLECQGLIGRDLSASIHRELQCDHHIARMRISAEEGRLFIRHSKSSLPLEVELRDYVTFVYQKLERLDPLDLIEPRFIEECALCELKQRVRDLFDFGPLTKFFDLGLSGTVTDVSIDVRGQTFISVNGTFLPIGERLHEYALEKAILRIKSKSGKQFDASHPFLNSDVDGVRVACVHDSVAGSFQLTLRRKSTKSFTLDQMQRSGSFPKWATSLLRSLIHAKKNIIVSGGLGSGKTSMLIALLSSFQPNWKIASIEDTREINLQGQHFSPLTTKPGVSEQELLESVLRSAADVIALGEIRSPKSADALVKALNTGQIGLSTIHSNSAHDTIARITNLLASGGGNGLPSVRQDISSAIDFVVHMERINGNRQIVELSEVGNIDRATGQIVLKPILEMQADGRLVPTGLLPSCVQSLVQNGFQIPSGRELFS